jgi:transposase
MRGLRQVLREEDVRFQAVRSWKRSTDPDFARKRDRILELYALAEQAKAVVICLDEFGPLNLQPQPGGKAWAPRAKPRRIRATYLPPHGVRHLLSAYDVSRDRLYGHVKKHKGRIEFIQFCRYIRSLYPPDVQLHFVLDNFSPHKGKQVRDWALDNNVELAYTPFYASWLNRIEAQFKALRYFPQRHRPPRPRHPSPTHPPLHRLAQPPHRRPQPAPPRQHSKRCLTLHELARTSRP